MMAVTSQEQNRDITTDRYPLLMERQENQHVIDIERGGDVSSSGLSVNASPCGPLAESGPYNHPSIPTNNTTSDSSSGSNSRNPSLRRSEGSGRRRWSPFDTLFAISIDFVFTLAQIIAAVAVLYVSRHENPQTPLFAWIVGYAAGCALSLPLLYWRYLHRVRSAEPGSAQNRHSSSQENSSAEPNSYITISLARSSEEENGQNISPQIRNDSSVASRNVRLSVFVGYFKMALDCFFAVWFVVGNIWIFGGSTSSSDAPNLYRLCIVFLTISCIGYAVPFILCGMICCCLPCIISFIGVREDMNKMRGASDDSINALPTYKFTLKRNGSSNSEDRNSGLDEGGIVGAGTEKERGISGEDAVCCICLARYTNDDSLRELPCTHFFHAECVDKWLKINALCPLCKFEIGNDKEKSTSPENSTQQT